VNRHNSRQGCNLDELTNQSKLIHDLASAQGTRVMRKLARIVTGVFEARHSHVGAKRCYGSKISKGRFIKVMIDLTELVRKGDTVRCPLVRQRSGKIYIVILRNSRCLQSYNPFNSNFKGITNDEQMQHRKQSFSSVPIGRQNKNFAAAIKPDLTT
jgi:hypothetical protein